jgi:hypothetical protein
LNSCQSFCHPSFVFGAGLVHEVVFFGASLFQFRLSGRYAPRRPGISNVFYSGQKRTDKFRLGAHRKPKCFPALEKAPERAVVAEKLTRIPEEPEFITMSFDQ